MGVPRWPWCEGCERCAEVCEVCEMRRQWLAPSPGLT